jgi:hypothetical protein
LGLGTERKVDFYENAGSFKGSDVEPGGCFGRRLCLCTRTDREYSATVTGLLKIRFDTRLSERKGEDGSVVFDKVGNELYLSEIYIIGMDGFFFKGAPGKHKHLVVKEELDK